MRPALLLALLALLLPVSSGRADEILFKGGGRLSCEILDETATELRVRLPHGTMIIPRAKVAGIVRETRAGYLEREGRRSLRDGATRSAVEMLQAALRLDPADAESRATLVAALDAHATALVAEFRLAAARAAVKRLVQLRPGSERARALSARIDRLERAAARLLERAQQAVARRAYLEAIVSLDAWRLLRPSDDAEVGAALAAAHLGAARTALKHDALRQALDHFRLAAAYGARRETNEPLYLLRPIAVLEALKQGDLEAARRLLDGIATTYPDAAVPLFLEAVVHHVRGEVEEAVAAYAESARVAERSRSPSRGLPYDLVRAHATETLRAAIARPPQEGVTTWRELFLGPLERDDGSLRFTVYAASAARAREVAAAADEIHARVARDLLGALPAASKAEIVLHPSREAYVAADPSPPGTPLASLTVDREMTRGVCYDTLDAEGRPLVRIEVDGAASRYLEDTLPHEIVHVVQRQGLRAFRKGHWLDEGLATLYESREGQAAREAAWRQRRDRRLPLPELLSLRSTPPDKAAVFYLEVHAFTRFLRGLGDAGAWRRFLAAFGAGTFQDAIREVYGLESVAALERLWEKSLRDG